MWRTKKQYGSFMVKISKQNDMEENGAAHRYKMMVSNCKSARHHNRWPQLRSDSNELWLDGCKKGSEIYLYITAKGQSYCHSIVISITAVSCVGRWHLPTHDTSIHDTTGTETFQIKKYIIRCSYTCNYIHCKQWYITEI